MRGGRSGGGVRGREDPGCSAAKGEGRPPAGPARNDAWADASLTGMETSLIPDPTVGNIAVVAAGR